MKLTTPPTTDYSVSDFRDEFIAASLKLEGQQYAITGGTDFRDEFIAASLKPRASELIKPMYFIFPR